MPDLWSPEIMKPTMPPRRPSKAVVVPRGRVEPKLKPARPTDISQLAAVRGRELADATAKAWKAGFEVASAQYKIEVTYPESGYSEVQRCKGIREIANEVCAAHGVSLLDVRSWRRDGKTVRCRHEIFWRCRQETPLSLPHIGHFMNRDHTSVLHGIRAHEARLAASTKGEGT